MRGLLLPMTKRPEVVLLCIPIPPQEMEPFLPFLSPFLFVFQPNPLFARWGIFFIRTVSAKGVRGRKGKWTGFRPQCFCACVRQGEGGRERKEECVMIFS